VCIFFTKKFIQFIKFLKILLCIFTNNKKTISLKKNLFFLKLKTILFVISSLMALMSFTNVSNDIVLDVNSLNDSDAKKVFLTILMTHLIMRILIQKNILLNTIKTI